MKKWAEMTWKEIDQLDRNTLLILPVGSTEQHGERLPVETDALFAEYWAKKTAEEIPDSILLPTLNYGMSWHHTAFPGTISLDGPVYALVIRNILESVARAGFHKVLIANGHGGNHKWIEQAIAEVREIYPDMVFSNPVIELIRDNDFKKIADSFGEDIVHAGAMEVSQIAAIEPEKVRRSSVVTNVPTGAKWGEGTNSPSEWKQKFPMGQKGDQRNCQVDKGEVLNKFIVLKLLEIAKKMME